MGVEVDGSAVGHQVVVRFAQESVRRAGRKAFLFRALKGGFGHFAGLSLLDVEVEFAVARRERDGCYGMCICQSTPECAEEYVVDLLVDGACSIVGLKGVFH